MTEPDPQLLINQALVPLLFQSLPFGEATRQAKAATIDSDVRRTWILFGDPTVRLK